MASNLVDLDRQDEICNLARIDTHDWLALHMPNQALLIRFSRKIGQVGDRLLRTSCPRETWGQPAFLHKMPLLSAPALRERERISQKVLGTASLHSL
jgi:hypothetical protein